MELKSDEMETIGVDPIKLIRIRTGEIKNKTENQLRKWVLGYWMWKCQQLSGCYTIWIAYAPLYQHISINTTLTLTLFRFSNDKFLGLLVSHPFVQLSDVKWQISWSILVFTPCVFLSPMKIWLAENSLWRNEVNSPETKVCCHMKLVWYLSYVCAHISISIYLRWCIWLVSV